MKKSGGVDRERVRGSSKLVLNGIRDLSFDTPIYGLFSLEGVFQLFAEKVKDNKELVSCRVVLEEMHIEYLRGKDFISFLRNHPKVKDTLESYENLETILVCYDRVVKFVRPGKKKLSSEPTFAKAAVFGALYIVLEKGVWFFPRILAEEPTLRELFLLLMHYGPTEAARARQRVYNIIDDVLEWSPRLALSGMMVKQQNVGNAIERNITFASGTKPLFC
ncbi:hypothetical protein K2173_022115 [Erythroxylum novogranatense]|uniref:Uncharacterized protein n=1 Tax=Erythroxylum novogranatense TaxID=1862640 RepID=A0AAV8TZ26_9ROSI|nr:hypothetical protein K2173_022115 [Erythroxylum novogranatense]